MSANLVLATAVDFLDMVHADWQADLSGAPHWFALEGERARDNALCLLQSIRLGTARNLLQAATVHEYIGAAWLETHHRSFAKAVVLQRLLKLENDVE